MVKITISSLLQFFDKLNITKQCRSRPCKHIITAIIGLPSKHQLNGILMVGREWPEIVAEQSISLSNNGCFMHMLVLTSTI